MTLVCPTLRHSTLALAVLTLAATLLSPAARASSARQEAPERILEQDPELDNLVDPPGYETVPLGTLGNVERTGQGEGAMILVPGFGFGGDVFDTLLEGWNPGRVLYTVTLPGFGGTQAPPTPSPDTSFGEQTWTLGAVDGVSEIIVRESLRDVVVVGHWIGGTQVALEVARRHPERVSAVVLLAGSARWVSPTPNPEGPDRVPLETRVANVDRRLAPDWFRTVTRETWNDNNFLPGDYAANPVLGLRYWRRAAEPPLHVWVRYLCEFFAQDATLTLDEAEAPILLVKPGLEGIYHDPGLNYLAAYLHRSWGSSPESRDDVEVVTLPGTRVIVWADDPTPVRQRIATFLESVTGEVR